MRKLFAILAAGGLLMGTSAQAAPVVVGATMSLEIQGLAPITFSGPGGTVSTTVGGGVIVPAGLVSLSAPIIVPVTASTAINYLSAMTILNAAAVFSASGITNQLPSELCPPGANQACNVGGGIGGAMGLIGAINVHIIPNIVVIPVNLNSARLGQGGSTNTPFTFDAAGWTTGAAKVNSPDGTVTTSGANGGGTMTLVSPVFVSALGNLLPLFAGLTLTGLPAVPEPGSLLLIGAGIAGLAILGRRR